MEFSVNDSYLPYKMTLDACKKNLDCMINQIQQENPNCEIILMVMNPVVDLHSGKRPKLEKINDVYRTMGRKRGLLLIDHYPA